MLIRHLTESDNSALLELYDTRQKFFTINKNEHPEIMEMNREAVKKLHTNWPQGPFVVYGAFENDQLISSCTVRYHRNDNSYKSFNWITRYNQTHLYNPVKNGISGIYQRILDESEAMGYYTWYSINRKNRWPEEKIYERYWNSIPSFKKYFRSIHAIIPANTKPIFEFHWDLMGKMIWPVDLVVKSAVLKPCYFPNGQNLCNIFLKDEGVKIL